VCTHEKMQLGTAAYWLSLRDREELPAEDGHPKSTVVEVPLGNLLTVDVLGNLLSGDLGGAVQ
jgi:hypothetical protein